MHTHINNGSWKYLLAACILLAQRWSEVHLLKETHAPFLSHCCSGYPVGPLMTLLQAGCNVWGPQQSCTRASAKPWEENKGWWKTRRKEYKEKRQLVTRTHSITLTMHLQPVCVCVALCKCVYMCVQWSKVLPSVNYSIAQSPHTAQVVQTKTCEVLPRE